LTNLLWFSTESFTTDEETEETEAVSTESFTTDEAEPTEFTELTELTCLEELESPELDLGWEILGEIPLGLGPLTSADNTPDTPDNTPDTPDNTPDESVALFLLRAFKLGLLKIDPEE